MIVFKKFFIIFIVIVQVLFINSNAQENIANYKEEWKSCVKNTECITVRGLCGKWVAINSKHKKDIESMKRKYAPLMFCGVLPDDGNLIPSAKCISNQCVFKKTITNKAKH